MVTITLEVQFVGSLVTEYLGIWLFSGDEKIPVKRVFREWRQRLFQLFYYLVFTRVIRFRSFYPETILLERHPFFGRAGRLSTRRRVKNINSADVGTEAFSAFIGTEFYILAGVVFGCVISYFFISTIMGDRVLSWFISTIFVFPTFLMACRLFNVVYNFCNYINYRISCEGWDVDLTFKTELVRLGVSLADATDGARTVALADVSERLVLLRLILTLTRPTRLLRLTSSTRRRIRRRLMKTDVASTRPRRHLTSVSLAVTLLLLLVLVFCAIPCSAADSSVSKVESDPVEKNFDRATKSGGYPWYSSKSKSVVFLPDRPRDTKVEISPRSKKEEDSADQRVWWKVLTLWAGRGVTITVCLLCGMGSRISRGAGNGLKRKNCRRQRRIETLAEEARVRYDDLDRAAEEALARGDLRSALVFYFS